MRERERAVSFERGPVSAKNLKVCLAALGGLVTLAVLALAGQASAATLSGPWAPFTNCPVNEPAFVSSPETKSFARCIAATSPSGSLTIGNTTVQTGSQSVQFGAPGSGLVPATEGQTLVAAPAQIPGGLVGLMCPSNILLVSELCNIAVNEGLNGVTATAELAGTPSNFNAFGAQRLGEPIFTLPIKIHLQNPLLGSSCYIGTSGEPIVLHPETTALGELKPIQKDPNGHAVTFLTVTGATQGDSKFAVPGTSGCGGALLSSVVGPAINLKEGLPSPAGKNDIVLDDATSNLAQSSTGHALLTEAWNAAA